MEHFENILVIFMALIEFPGVSDQSSITYPHVIEALNYAQISYRFIRPSEI